MKQSPDNQINVFSHWQAPTQRPIIDQRPVEPMVEQTTYRREIKDNGYKSVFTNSWLVRQRNRFWIKGIRQKSPKEWTRSLLAVHFVRGHRIVTPWTLRNDCVYTSATIARHAWRVDKAPAKTHKNRNACLNGLRCKLVKTNLCPPPHPHPPPTPVPIS